jgi:hypothetical protein
MKKRVLGLGLGALVAGVTLASLTSCGTKDVFHIYAWNEEFKGFFEKYLCDEKDKFVEAAEKKDESLKPKTYHLDGKEVKWTIVPSDDGQYQTALDNALAGNANANTENKVDMFLAEADYILKYTNSDATKDVTKIGVTDFSTVYNYTKQAASDASGVVKGVSFQCCPAGVIYRRSIAKELLGVDKPEEVQEKINTWEKFNSYADVAKEKGYLMTGSFAATYRAFSNNTSKPWVDKDGYLQMDDQIKAWMDQTVDFNNKKVTKTDGIWDGGCTQEMYKTGKAFCYFGPAWYYNFSMSNAQDPDKGCFGDWGLVEGPASYFWGGTWMLAANGGDDDALVKKTMNAFINDKDLCKKLVKNEGQFSNNQNANKEVAAEYDAAGEGNKFLGGQNDTKLYLELAKNIKFQNQTIYDQYCNEGLQNKFAEFLKGSVTKEQAINNFKDYIKTKAPEVKTDKFTI